MGVPAVEGYIWSHMQVLCQIERRACFTSTGIPYSNVAKIEDALFLVLCFSKPCRKILHGRNEGVLGEGNSYSVQRYFVICQKNLIVNF